MLFWQRFFYDYDVMGVFTVNIFFDVVILGLKKIKQQPTKKKRKDE